MNKKILILDFDLYSGAIALSLNIPNEQDIYQLMDDLNSNRFKMIDPYLVKYNENIDVIPSLKDPRNASKINSKYISVILSKVIHRYDIILIDTNYFLNDITLIALDASDEILYILEGDPIDLKSMATRLTIHKDMEKENYKIILNEARTKDKEHFSKSDIKNVLKENVDYVIPKHFYIKNIDKYMLDGIILTLHKGIINSHKKGIDIFKEIANALLKEKNDKK